MKNTFELTTPLSKTKEWAGQIKIVGEYWQENGELNVDIISVYHSSEQVVPMSDWRYIPNTFWTWLDSMDKIGEIAFEHCKFLMAQDHYCQTQNKLS